MHPDSAPVRVCTVPGRHPYVDRCLVGAAGVVHCDDPAGSTSYADPWHPSPVLEPQWIRAHAAEMDVLHVHFGFEHRAPQQLSQWAQELKLIGLPLVVTVHDLDNPHLTDQRLHHESLGVLIDAAAALVTLTPGAAGEIGRRYAKTPRVVPHPHQFALKYVGARSRPRAVRGGRIGVNLRSLRPNVDAESALRLLRQLPADWTAVVRVSAAVANGIGDRAGGRIAEQLRDGVAAGCWEVHSVPGWSSEHDLWEFVAGLDALLLPYRWGTHSGWVESCWDVGTEAVAPAVGHYAGQHPITEVAPDATGEILHRALASITPATKEELASRVGERQSEQLEIAATHALLYREVLR